MRNQRKLLEGAEDCVTREELKKKLQKRKFLKVKYGADPSKPDLHIGHLVCLEKLRDFQEQGHRIIFVIGDFTAMIGDPSGKSKTRPRLSKEEVARNSKTYLDQVFRVLDRTSTEIVYNSRWLSKLTPEKIIELASFYTVARMLERNDFKERLESGNPISIHEFLYPLFQAYDSYHLNVDVEIGGTDQHFNFALTREVQRCLGQEPQVFITVPLIEGTDGKLKMSKTYGNAIGITEPPEEIFGKLMSIPDALLQKYYRVLLRKKDAETKKQINRNPLSAKENLAYTVTKKLYGKKEADRAKKSFIRIFRKKQIPEKVRSITLKKERRILDILADSEIGSSRSEVKRLIREGAVKFDSKKIADPNFVVKESGMIRIGKRKFLEVKD